MAPNTSAQTTNAISPLPGSPCWEQGERQMRLLIISDRFPPEEVGGAERIAYYNAQALKGAGWQVSVVTGTQDHRNHAARNDGLQLFSAFRLAQTKVGFYGLWAKGAVYNPGAAAAVRRAVRVFQPDLIHCHVAANISLASLAQFAPAIPTVVTFHGYQFECPKGGLYRKREQLCEDKPIACGIYSRYNRMLLSKVDRIIAISRFNEARLLQAGFERERVVYLPNGVPSIEDRPPEPLPQTPAILYVGQLEAHKGVSWLIRSFSRISDPAATLSLVGDGREKEKLRRLAEGDRRIRMVGRVPHEQVQEYYKASRIVAVPSLWHEVMNTVICEAQAWSRPVVTTGLGGNPDLIEDGVSGVFVPPGDESALTAALTRLLHDEAGALRLALGGYAHVRQFSMRRHRDALLSVYKEILDERL
jgi:glycosyltransferase involved in cell wall biosynthesis